MTNHAAESLASTLARLRQTVSQLHATTLMLSPAERAELEAALPELRAVAAKLYAALDRGPGREVADGH